MNLNISDIYQDQLSNLTSSLDQPSEGYPPSLGGSSQLVSG